MADDQPTDAELRAGVPLLGYSPLHVGLRYLLRKSLSYMAVIGIALAVGTIIVVMSVFTGFHMRMVDVLRGYASDLTIKAYGRSVDGLDDWQAWRRRIIQVEHVTGVAPYVESFGLVRLPGTDSMMHVMLRGIDPDLEGDVSKMPEYMRVGKLGDLRKTHALPNVSERGEVRSCFVGSLFPGFRPEYQLFNPDTLDVAPGRLALVTVTSDLQTRLSPFAVNGLFDTKYTDYDSQVVLMDLESAMDFVKSDGGVTGLRLRLDDYANAPQVRAALHELLAPGMEMVRFESGADKVRLLAFGDEGTRLAGMLDSDELVVWDVATGDETARLPIPGDPVTALALSADGGTALTGHESGAAALWTDELRERVPISKPGGAAVSAVAFSPIGFSLAVAREDGTAAVYDAEDGAELAKLPAHTGRVNAVSFDRAEGTVLTAGADGRVHVSDVETGRPSAVLGFREPAPITAAAFSPDGKRVVTGDESGRLMVWDAAKGALLGGRQMLTGPMRAVTFGLGPGRIVSAGDGEVLFWGQNKPDSWASLTPYNVASHADAAAGFAFRPDSRGLAVIGKDGTARLLYTGPDLMIETWENQQRTLLEAVAVERFLQALIMSLILIVALFFIFAILITIVNERRRDIGILKSIGFTGGQICRIFIIIGMAIGTTGGLLGAVGGVLFSENINGVRYLIKEWTGFDPFPPTVYYFTEIPHHVDGWTLGLTAGGAVIGSLLFSIWPAFRAARLDPVRTLHYE